MHRPGDLASMLSDHQSRFVSMSDLSCLWKEGGEDARDRSFCRYNEVVVSAAVYTSALPNVIEAFFIPINGDVVHRHGTPERARQAREAFRRRFGLSRAQTPPLFFYDIGLAQSGHAQPFSLARRQ